MGPEAIRISPGTVVQINSKTSKFKGAIGEVVGYCHGKRPEICKVRLADMQTINICDYSLEVIDVEMEYGGSKVDLRTCPFCGSAPLIHSYRNRMRLWYRIKCSDEKEVCRMIPETSASRKLVEAAADWNQHGSRDAVLEEIWQQLTDIPMNPETECLEAPFYDWPEGTHREEIWHWFDERHSKGVAYLLYGTPNKTEGE